MVSYIARPRARSNCFSATRQEPLRSPVRAASRSRVWVILLRRSPAKTVRAALSVREHAAGMAGPTMEVTEITLRRTPEGG